MLESKEEINTLPKRVLIVGAGACGLVTLRNFLERGDFEDVQVVERRDRIGGVWYLDDPESNRSYGRSNQPRWPSPAYPGLIGNVLPEFLSFSGHPFPRPPAEDQPFPTLVETHHYLEKFAQSFLDQGKIRLNCNVVGVDEITQADGGGWKVSIQDWNDRSSGRIVEEKWDAVVITGVYYDNPKYPDIDGLEEARKTGLIRHAITWRGPTGYESKRVLVVGNANSANDIAAQLAPVAQTPVYRCSRRPSIFPYLPDERVRDIKAITRYAVVPTSEGENKIEVQVQDGSTIREIDYVIFCTGYYPHVPYLRVLDPTKLEPDDVNTSFAHVPLSAPNIRPRRIPSLFRQTLYAYNPTLAFIGAIISLIPYLLADLNSTWLALAWSGELEYPHTPEERLLDEEHRVKLVTDLRKDDDQPSELISYHYLSGEELAYAQKMRAEVIHAQKDLDDVLARWDEAADTRRQGMHAIKSESLRVQAISQS